MRRSRRSRTSSATRPRRTRTSTLLASLARLGAGADVVSGGELRAAWSPGFRPTASSSRASARRTPRSLARRLPAFSRSTPSRSARSRRSTRRGAESSRSARVALRVNPDIDARSHPYISTGRKHNKFGVDIGLAAGIYERARRLPHVRMTGIQAHIGSQILDPEPLAQTARELASSPRRFAGTGIPSRRWTSGGGIGIGRPRRDPADPGGVRGRGPSPPGGPPNSKS